ncbi:hypothetical protein [Priestia megaterium]|uniref:Uncharacterized protein n=1 Tax=Priestia megaterium TaxID=1404 RepID=A0A6M6E5E2_PRIMG|nr:hypothetical protein [Priestia megaterium]QJX80744.1 hypothetical protein FDZ14_32150 [Priestia megaterium]
MKATFDVNRVLLLDTTFEPHMLEKGQAVIGTIEGESIFMIKITPEQLDNIRLQAKAESQLGSYEFTKRAYNEFKEMQKAMRKTEGQLLKKLQGVCPHDNTYKVEDDDFLNIDEVPYHKCKDCGSIVK